MKRINSMIMLLLVTVLPSCDRALDRDGYIRWARNEKNGLRAIQTRNGHYFYLQYQPAEMVYLQRNPENSLSGAEREKELERISGLQYFTLTIGLGDRNGDFIRSGTSDQGERQEKIYYFSYPFQEDIFLLENGKKLPPVLFHFERSMDMKNSRTFVLGFENTGPGSGTATFLIDSPLFGPEPIELKINKTDIKKLKP